MASDGLTAWQIPTTTLFGREDAIAEVVELARSHRIVTLVGPGGVGKTRIAAAAAHWARDDFDTVVFADLLSASEPGGLFPLLAEAIGVRGGHDPWNAVRAALCDRRALVVLDNCEHLGDAAAACASALTTTTCAHVLATSRRRLSVSGERVWIVPPLAVDGIGRDPSPAASLLVDRAVRAGVRADKLRASDPVIESICRRLEGIPLAIELAAGRLNVVSVDEVLRQLAEGIAILGGGPNDVPKRQRTMDASIRWSWHLLDPTLQEALARLSCWSTTFDIDAVAAAASVDRRQAVDVVATLVDHSLVQALFGRISRFRIAESVKAFARQQLAMDPAAEISARDAHRLWTNAAIASAAEARDNATLAALIPELEVAVAAPVTAPDDALLGAVLAMWSFLKRRRPADGLRLIDTLTKRGVESDALAARAAMVAADLAAYSTSKHVLHAWADRALESAQRAGSDSLLGHALQASAWSAIVRGDKAALDHARRAVEVRRRLGRTTALAESLHVLGLGSLLAGDAAAARAAAAEALAVTAGHPRNARDRALTCASMVAAVLGDLVAADRSVGEALDGVELGEASIDVEVCRAVGARLDGLRGNHARAIAAAEGVANNATHSGVSLVLAVATWAEALVRAEGGDEHAVPALARAVAVNREEGLAAFAAMAAAACATWHVTQLDFDAAHASLRSAEDLASAPFGAGATGWVSAAAARLALAEGDGALGERAIGEAVLSFHERNDRLGLIVSIEVLAGIVAGRDLTTAQELVAAADAARRYDGTRRSPAYDDTRGVGASVCAGRPIESIVGELLPTTHRRQRPAAGVERLTKAERQVAQLAASGLRNQDIASRLFVSPETVKSHLASAYRKLGVGNRTELAAHVVPGRPQTG